MMSAARPPEPADGNGTTHADDRCMARDGCDRPATRFESDPDHWHDWVWCADHALDRITVSRYDSTMVDYDPPAPVNPPIPINLNTAAMVTVTDAGPDTR